MQANVAMGSGSRSGPTSKITKKSKIDVNIAFNWVFAPDNSHNDERDNDAPTGYTGNNDEMALTNPSAYNSWLAST
jgi:hypothetical protein